MCVIFHSPLIDAAILPTLLVSTRYLTGPRVTFFFFFIDYYIHMARIVFKRLHMCCLGKQNQKPEQLESILQFNTVPLPNGLTGTSRA